MHRKIGEGRHRGDRRGADREASRASQSSFSPWSLAPLAGKIGRRPAIDLDLAELFRACARTGTAQRGWLTPDDVINTWPLNRLTAFLAKG
jgi:DNA polymerase (family 10)